MDFELHKEQIEFIEAIKELCNQKINDNVYEDDENSSFPRHKWDELGDFGIHAFPVPEEYGGLGQNMLTTALAIQALSRYCKDEGLIFSTCAHILTCTLPILNFGSEKQRIKYLPKLAAGKLIGGNATTEPEAGSDSSSLQSTITKDGDTYILNGSKLFITNAPVADLLVIYARHPGGMKSLDMSAFIIEKENPGLLIGQVFHKMGLRTSPIGEVILNNCRVNEECILGRERFGMQIFNHSMLWERIIMSAYHLGAMEQQYDLAWEYAYTRKQFGKSILEFSSISDKLVDMKMRIETTKLLLYQTCWKNDIGQDVMTDASMIKLLSSESKVKNSLDAVQLFGAYGYMKENMIEKQLRDSVASKIYSGTSEIQRKIIAENL